MHTSTPISAQSGDSGALVALKTAVFSVLAFSVIPVLRHFSLLPFPIPEVVEAVVRIVAVVWIVRTVAKAEKRKNPVSDLPPNAFVSSIFFYGITLAFLYVMDIGVIIAELFFRKWEMTGTMAFLLGVPDFSTAAIVKAFFFSHFPYVAYYLSVRYEWETTFR